MIGNLLDFLRNLGLLGLGVLFLGFVLLVAGALMVGARSSRSKWAVYMVLGLAPLVVGAAGTALGNAAIERAIASGAATSPAEVARGRRTADSPLQIGGVASAVALVLGVVGLALGGAGAGRERVH